jgi:predicted DNA-binding transcriptional regulator YafY
MPLSVIYSGSVRARRLVSLLLLLQLGRRFTAAELADRLGTSVRTIHRDVAALVDAGVPIQSDRGPGGGFTLPGAYRTRLPLTIDEAQALLLGTPGAAASLGLGALLLDAQAKLLGSLPPDMRQAARRARELFHVDDQRWFTSPDEPEFLAPLASAAAERQVVGVEYERRGGTAAELLKPLGLVLKAGVWYVLSGDADGTAIHRVSRIRSLALSAERFRRPPGFDLAEAWQRSREEFETSRPELAVRLLARRDDLPALRAAVDGSVRPTVRVGDAAPDGRIEVVLTFERLDHAHADLLRLGGAVEVTAPQELRDRLAATGRELAQRYA